MAACRVDRASERQHSTLVGTVARVGEKGVAVDTATDHGENIAANIVQDMLICAEMFFLLLPRAPMDLQLSAVYTCVTTPRLREGCAPLKHHA